MGFQNTWKISMKQINCVICFVIVLNCAMMVINKPFKLVLYLMFKPREHQHLPQKREMKNEKEKGKEKQKI